MFGSFMTNRTGQLTVQAYYERLGDRLEQHFLAGKSDLFLFIFRLVQFYMPSSRQLTAIMFADIAGYTSLMQEDEAMALELRNKFLQKIGEETSAHNGRILDIKGDGALCSFASTIEAVKAAISLQLEMQADPVVPLRIGMHAGDVIMEATNIYGDGVNIASRVESFAVPGSIFISGKVYDDVKNQKDIQAISLGKYMLKNVRDEMELFAISNPGIKIPDKNKLQGKGEKVGENLRSKCVMVLPFVNMSNDPEQEYFSDGLTEELISKLATVRDLRVISRTTSMQYKGTKKGARTIGSENDVNYIVEGSVRTAGNNLRITAQFIDADRDIHLWAETYRGTMDDIFDIQERVSEKIVEALRIQLTRDEQSILGKRYTENTAAYQLYLKGRHFWKERNEEGLEKAANHFQKALEIDPDYALAWVGLADTYSLMGEYSNVSRRILFPKQMAAVNRALELDNRLGEAHISLAISLMLNEWDWKNSEKEYKLGIELSPTYATGHHWYGEWLLFNGKIEEAFEEINIAVELEPLSPGILKDKGIFYYYRKQYNQAINMGLMTLEVKPDFAPAYRLLSLSYAGLKMFDEAISNNERWRELTGNKTKTDIALAEIYALANRNEEAKKIISSIDTDEPLSGNDYRGMALVYIALGEHDLALTWLEKSYAHHEESLCSIKVDAKWDPIRSERRFT
ncbi:MAG TPA: adenylate/guanylate cyclase domain-containing protein, partial [Parafilimonas sp.]|nr:adenylate/guanylate cyclase domain-containing protein [Parafilimonas sp.]